MTGEDCSQPPLGVAVTTLPHRSATSRWQVSPRLACGCAWADRPSGSPVAGSIPGSPLPRWRPRCAGQSQIRRCRTVPWRMRAAPISLPPGRPGTQSALAVSADELAALVVVRVGEQVVEGHVGEVRVAVPGLTVGEGELAALGHSVDVLGAAGLERRQVEAGKQRELLQEHRALAPRAGSCTRSGPGSRRWPAASRRACQVARSCAGEQAAVPLPGDVHHLGGRELADLLGDEPVVPGAPRRLDLLVAVGAGRLRLGEDALVGGGERGLANLVPGAGTPPPGR